MAYIEEQPPESDDRIIVTYKEQVPIAPELSEWDVDYEYRNPVWNRHGTIDLEINHPKMGWVPCTVDNIDYTLMWARLMNDTVAPYVPDIEFLSAQFRRDRTSLLQRYVDPYVSNPLRWADMPQEQKDAITAYRQALLDIPESAEFPLVVVWPEPPKDVQS